MSMAKFTVDTTNKLFVAKSGITSFNIKQDLYSDAKEHWIADATAMKFDFPIRTIGGDPIGGGKFAGDLYFIRNGWKIRPQEVDHTLTIDGNLFLDDGEVGELIVPTVGDYTVLTIGERSNLVIGIETGGGGGTDWISTEKAEIRHRLGIAGTSQAPTITPSLVNAVFQTDVDTLEAGAPVHSLLSAVLKLVCRFNARTGYTYKTTGAEHMKQQMIVDTGMQPIGEVGVGEAP